MKSKIIAKSILLCGSRNWDNREIIKTALKKIQYPKATPYVIHGVAKGADTIGKEEAEKLGFVTKAYEADWDRYGKKAIYLRNIDMINSNPHVVLAFCNYLPRCKGTSMTIELAKQHGIPVILFSE